MANGLLYLNTTTYNAQQSPFEVSAPAGVDTLTIVAGDVLDINGSLDVTGATIVGGSNVNANTWGSGAAVNGTVLTANGAGGSAWVAPPAGTLQGVYDAGTGVINLDASGDFIVNLDSGSAGDSFKVASSSGGADALTLTSTGANAMSLAADTTTTALSSSSTTDIDAAGALSLNSSAAAINVGNDAVAQPVNIGTGAAARTVTVGNTTGATGLVFNTGTGGAAFNLADNDASAFTIKEGANVYADITTTNAGESMTFGGATNPTITLDGTGQKTINGNLNATGGVDVTGGDLTVAAANDINVGAGNFTVDGTTGDLHSEGGIDADGDLRIGAAGASKVTVDSATGDTLIAGNLTVTGTMFIADTQQVLIEDNNLYMNCTDVTPGAGTGGLTVNYNPTATTDTVAVGGITAGVAAVSNPTVATTGAATFGVGDFVQITGANNAANKGLFEILSHAANVATIRGVGLTACQEDFTQNQFVTDATVAGTMTKVNLSIIRSGTDGNWEVAKGSSSPAGTPLTFTDLTTEGGTTLQEAYEGGNTIALANGDGNLEITATAAGGGANMVVKDAGGNFFATDSAGSTLDLGSAAKAVDVVGTSVVATGNPTWNMGTGQVDMGGNLDASNGVDIDADNKALTVGAGADVSLTHDGANSTMTSTTGNFTVDNTAAAGKTILMGGTDTAATGVQIKNNSGTTLAEVDSTGQADFNGNVDANSGMDVTGADLTVSGQDFRLGLDNDTLYLSDGYTETFDGTNVVAKVLQGDTETWLSDAAGASSFQVCDSAGVAQITGTSDGDLTITGTMTIPTGKSLKVGDVFLNEYGMGCLLKNTSLVPIVAGDTVKYNGAGAFEISGTPGLTGATDIVTGVAAVNIGVGLWGNVYTSGPAVPVKDASGGALLAGGFAIATTTGGATAITAGVAAGKELVYLGPCGKIAGGMAYVALNIQKVVKV